MQLASITRRFGTAVLAAACAGVGGCAAPPEPPAVERAREVAWTEAPGYADLFAPRAHRDAYQFFTSPHALQAILPLVAQDPAAVPAPGGWTARPLLPFEAFGQGGEYDRSRLARLYGARRAQVARGPRQDAGRLVESWTLVSPYPDIALRGLEPGTLLVVLRLP